MLFLALIAIILIGHRRWEVCDVVYDKRLILPSSRITGLIFGSRCCVAKGQLISLKRYYGSAVVASGEAPMGLTPVDLQALFFLSKLLGIIVAYFCAVCLIIKIR